MTEGQSQTLGPPGGYRSLWLSSELWVLRPHQRLNRLVPSKTLGLKPQERPLHPCTRDQGRTWPTAVDSTGMPGSQSRVRGCPGA